MLAICLLVIGVLSRLLPHTANFTPVMALALFGGAYLKKKHAVLLVLLLMVLSDAVIGFHDIVFFTWGSVVLIALLGRALPENKAPGAVLVSSVLSAVIFFVVTNFGSWLVMYPLSFEGFVRCYALAVPFFRGTLLSTLVYSVVLFGLYESAAFFIRKTRFAQVWL